MACTGHTALNSHQLAKLIIHVIWIQINYKWLNVMFYANNIFLYSKYVSFSPKKKMVAICITGVTQHKNNDLFQLSMIIIHYNWASEVSPTLGCSIEISRDISESAVALSM